MDRTTNTSDQRRASVAPGLRKPGAGKGHDVVFHTLKTNNRKITIITMATGDKITGMVTGFDKYTVTVMGDDGIRQIIYKHSIERFWGEEPAAGPAAAH